MLRGDLGRLVGYYLPRNIGGKVVPFTTGLNCWRLLVEKGQLQKLKRSPNDTFTIAFNTPPKKNGRNFSKIPCPMDPSTFWEDTLAPKIVPQVHSKHRILGSIGMIHGTNKENLESQLVISPWRLFHLNKLWSLHPRIAWHLPPDSYENFRLPGFFLDF